MSGACPRKTGRTLRSEVHSTRDMRRPYADYRARGNVRGHTVTRSSQPHIKDSAG